MSELIGAQGGASETSELRCLGSGECEQYCQALCAMGLEGYDASDCQIPEILSDEESTKIDESVAGLDDSGLALAMIDRLKDVLVDGNNFRAELENDSTEIAQALHGFELIHVALKELWTQYVKASREKRIITDMEVLHFSKNYSDTMKAAHENNEDQGVSPSILRYARSLHDRASLDEEGILFDSSMVELVTSLFANVHIGKSTLILGDKGIAKTQAARFVARSYSHDGEARIISGDGSMMKDEFIGKVDLVQEGGATVTKFTPGILTECMEKGIPLVIDEINLIDPAIIMRLQDILLRKPGDQVVLQEDGGRVITIQRGFAVIATANEASSRYQSRAAFDPAFRDRFDIRTVGYPDHNTRIVDSDSMPPATLRLALTAAWSPNGIPNEYVSIGDAQWLAQLCHASQQLYSRPAKDIGASRFAGASSAIVDEDMPSTTDCITPRKMMQILEEVSSGTNPYTSLKGVQGKALEAIASMQQREDRQVHYEVVRLLHDASESGEFDTDKIKSTLGI